MKPHPKIDKFAARVMSRINERMAEAGCDPKDLRFDLNRAPYFRDDVVGLPGCYMSGRLSVDDRTLPGVYLGEAGLRWMGGEWKTILVDLWTASGRHCPLYGTDEEKIERLARLLYLKIRELRRVDADKKRSQEYAIEIQNRWSWSV